ncbi:hypothetical protein [Saliniramus fredricksonii]|uniref:Uncharacterized protein n=1 Tax=Saliniramus fredricksonii TaxID=1653334 RepID=A0ABY0KAA4_9HYPH|nr:hypothetical protein [Saliniramus fredricksonii]SCC81399.1 hypothetical protein GA0071312_2337 [Saliniramus fredricksonii]
MMVKRDQKIRGAAGLLFHALVAFAVLAIAPANADTVPGFVAGDNRHLSFDPSPVTVLFRYSDGVRELRIPRQYIVIASGDFSSRDGPIPDQIDTHAVTLAIAYPDGEAWTIATRDYIREHGTSARMVGAEMRYEFNKVVVRRSGPVDYRTRSYGSERAERDAETGLLSFTQGKSNIRFIGDESDYFGDIDCSQALNPRWLCDYRAHITHNIAITASFVDFRLHGGREFANQRMRFIRETVCTFTSEC